MDGYLLGEPASSSKPQPDQMSDLDALFGVSSLEAAESSKEGDLI